MRVAVKQRENRAADLDRGRLPDGNRGVKAARFGNLQMCRNGVVPLRRAGYGNFSRSASGRDFISVTRT